MGDTLDSPQLRAAIDALDAPIELLQGEAARNCHRSTDEEDNVEDAQEAQTTTVAAPSISSGMVVRFGSGEGHATTVGATSISPDIIVGHGSGSHEPWVDTVTAAARVSETTENIRLTPADSGWPTATSKAAALFAPPHPPFPPGLPNPPKPSYRTIATQASVTMDAIMISGSRTSELWAANTPAEMEAHVKMCRYLEWQDKLREREREFRFVGIDLTRTEVRCRMRMNTEETKQRKIEQGAAGSKQPPTKAKVPVGPSARRIRRAKARAAKREAQEQQAHP